MATKEFAEVPNLVHTACGRTIAVSRFAPGELPPGMGRVVLDTPCEPYDQSEVWASLTPGEARALAALLVQQAAAVEAPRVEAADQVEAVLVRGGRCVIAAGKHVMTVDQPTPQGGTDAGPTPEELLVAAVAGCVALTAGRFLSWHEFSGDGLRVSTDYTMSAEPPSRITALTLYISAPLLPPEREKDLLAAVSHCAVDETLTHRPEITFGRRGAERCASPIS
ncbi:MULTISPECIES: OsmC family protein [unclassified Kitasatospora]|uniref:OsmC family protein n=1 Tax=unclassified Kitasatospora TaxID=2633591 RepID=UPI0033D1FC66